MSKGEEAEQGPLEDDVLEEESPSLEDQLAEALREKDQFKLMALRARADLENYRKRRAKSAKRRDAARTPPSCSGSCP